MTRTPIIFNMMGIDTGCPGQRYLNELLPFVPGLVGGHCIGVDPYYLTYKAEAMATTASHPGGKKDQR